MSDVRVPDDQARDLAWLYQATDRVGGHRPALQRLWVSPKVALALDGFRIHVLRLPEDSVLKRFATGLVRFVGRLVKEERWYEAETNPFSGSGFPKDLGPLLPRPKDDLLATFAVNPKHLRQALDGSGGYAIVKVYKNSIAGGNHSLIEVYPIDGITGEGLPARYALIMGLALTPAMAARAWRPTQEELP